MADTEKTCALIEENKVLRRALRDMALLSIHPELHSKEWVDDFIEWRVNRAMEVARGE